MSDTQNSQSQNDRRLSRLWLTVWTGADKVLPMLYGVTVVFIPMRIFNRDQWAVWSVFNLVFMVLSMVSDFFILQPMVKLCSEHSTDRRSVITASALLYTAFCLGLALLIGLGAGPMARLLKTPQADVTFQALVLVMAATIIRNIGIRVLQADYRIIAIFLVDLTYFATVIGLMVLGYYNKTFVSALDLVHYNIYALGASSVAGLLLCGRALMPGLHAFRRSARQVLDLGIHQGGTGFLTVLQQYGDVGIVSGIRGSTELGIYNAARMFYQSFVALREGAQLLLVPAASRAYSQQRLQAVQELTELSTAALVVLCVPFTVFVILLAPLIANIVMPNYPEAVDEFQWLMANGFLLPFVIVPSAVLLGIGQARSLFRGTLVGTIALVGIGVALTWFLGSLGTAIGVFVGTSVTAIILTRRMNEYVHFTFRSVLRRSRSFGPLIRNKIREFRSPADPENKD